MEGEGGNHRHANSGTWRSEDWADVSTHSIRSRALSHDDGDFEIQLQFQTSSAVQVRGAGGHRDELGLKSLADVWLVWVHE